MLDSQRVLNDLTSWYWWLMVVVAGLAINLASAYLKAPVDRVLARWSRKRQHVLDLKEKNRHLHAQRLAVDPTLLALEVRNESVSILLAIFSMAMAAVFIALATWMKSTLLASISVMGKERRLLRLEDLKDLQGSDRLSEWRETKKLAPRGGARTWKA